MELADQWEDEEVTRCIDEVYQASGANSSPRYWQIRGDLESSSTCRDNRQEMKCFTNCS